MIGRLNEVADVMDIAGWVRRAADGDGTAWERLVDQYASLIWWITRDFKLSENDAADVIQMTWLRLLEHIRRLDHPERVGSWLASTARHECLRTLAARKKVVLGFDGDSVDVIAAPDPEVDERLLAAERALTVRQALSCLPRRHQQLLELLMADPPPSYAEISGQLGLPIGSIGPIRGRCLARLRLLLQNSEANWLRTDSPYCIPAWAPRLGASTCSSRTPMVSHLESDINSSGERLAMQLAEVQETAPAGNHSLGPSRPKASLVTQVKPGCWAADQALTDIYCTEYDSLVRMAASLVSDIDTAEEVVQDSFVATQGAWPQLRDSDKALAYVRQSVMNRSRSVIRRRMVVDRHPPKPEPDAPSAEHSAMIKLERSTVMSALRLLPQRQREVLVLKFYFGLREGQIASTMGISRGTVKVHIARAMITMRDILAPRA